MRLNTAADAQENVATEECRESRAYKINTIKDGGVNAAAAAAAGQQPNRVALGSGQMSSRSNDGASKKLASDNNPIKQHVIKVKGGNRAR